GTIVANGVTLEAEQQLAAAYADYGGSLSRISVECAERLGALNGWTPMRTFVQWHARKPERTTTPCQCTSSEPAPDRPIGSRYRAANFPAPDRCASPPA